MLLSKAGLTPHERNTYASQYPSEPNRRKQVYREVFRTVQAVDGPAWYRLVFFDDGIASAAES